MGKQALPGKRSDIFHMDPAELIIIGLDTDHKEGEHPLYDPRIKLPLDESLVLNIMVYGVIDPIKVRKEGDDPVVADGRQRLRAAREAKKRLLAEGKEPLLVPVLLRRGSDATMYGVMVSANENRQDDDILTKADKAGRMLDMGKTEEEVAIAFGVQTQTVQIWLKLLDLGSDVRKAVESGTISASAAAKLAPLNREEQVSALKDLVASGKATTASAAAIVKGRRNGETVNPAPSKRTIRKLIEHVKSLDEEALDDEFIRGVRWAIGDLPTTSIGGLTALITDAKS